MPDRQALSAQRSSAAVVRQGASRREVLGRLGILPALGVAALATEGEAADEVDAVTAPTRIVISSSDCKEYWRLKKLKLDDPKVVAKQKKMPVGKIGELTLGRLISGSNLISMNMHARDLGYVNGLAKAYNTQERILMTLKKCEEVGGNSIVLKDHNFEAFRLQDYWSKWGGKMVWLADVITTDINQFERRLVKHLKLGASSAYLWGGASDIWYHQGKQANIVKAYEIMRKYDIPVGIGAHRLEPIVFCEREGLKPDYYFKTLHHDHEKTVAFMQHVKIPWIAFKVLAAGAIRPKDGIQYAFEGGADFICLGMFDFQVEEDAKLVQQCVAKAKDRKRPWA